MIKMMTKRTIIRNTLFSFIGCRTKSSLFSSSSCDSKCSCSPGFLPRATPCLKPRWFCAKMCSHGALRPIGPICSSCLTNLLLPHHLLTGISQLPDSSLYPLTDLFLERFPGKSPRLGDTLEGLS